MMKKVLSFVLTVLMSFSLAACSNTNDAPETGETGSPTGGASSTPSMPPESNSFNGDRQSAEASSPEAQSESKILIAYFSRAGENYNVGTIEKGNTQIIAEMIAEQTEGTLFYIETAAPYPEDYDETTEIVQEEKNNNARPELTGSVANMEDYDVVFLGYPIWWADMPMALYTFLESYDFSGKTIIPFCTNEGSGLADTVQSISNTCSEAEVLDGFAIRGKTAQESQDEAKQSVINWLNENDIMK